MPTALLLIDLQRGAFDGVRCPPIDAPERLVGNAGRLIEAARAGRHPIVFIQHCARDQGEAFEEGSVHWLLHESLQPQGERETTLRKYSSSAFDDTALDAQLKAQGVDTLLLCGLQSDFCVSNTALAALQLGYRVQLAQDAHGTWPSAGRSSAEILEQVDAQLANAGAEVASTDRLVAQLSAR